MLLPIKGSHGPPVPRGAGLRSRAAALLAFPALLFAALPAAAQNATWNNPATVAGPVGGTFDFDANANWTPATVPTGTASFGTSSTAALSFSANTTIGGWTFNAGASNYTFTNGHTLTFNGAGIVVNGGSATITTNGALEFQNASTAGSAAITSNVLLQFLNTSTAGSATITTNSNMSFNNASTAGHATITDNLVLDFNDTSTAGSAHITNNSNLNFNSSSTAGSANITNTGGGLIQFGGSSTAGSATITNNSNMNFNNASTAGSANITNNGFGTVNFNNTSTAGSANVTNANVLNFNDTSTAGHATITNASGAIMSFLNASTAGSAIITNDFGMSFDNSSTAGSATITNVLDLGFNDTSTAGSATITNSGNSTVGFSNTSTAGSATIINNGDLIFNDASTGGKARLINGAGGSIDLSQVTSAGITAGSIEGAGTISLGSKNLAVGGNNLSTTFSGVLQDGGLGGGAGGSLTKAGSGALTLSGINTYTGNTTVDGGSLLVNGSIATSALTTVNSGGTLGGTGTVGATQVNAGGIFAPGSGAPGTSMAVTGNLAFQSGALYLVQLNPATASFAKVTGGATLGGANVNAMFANGSYISKQYTILTAAGGVSGTFGSVVNTNLPFNFKTALSYDANDAFLNLSLAFVPPPGSGLSGNQQAVGNAISNFFNSNGSIPLVFGGLTPNGLTQVSGETATGSQQTTFDAMGQFMGLLTDPFMQRNGSPGSAPGASGYADEASAYAANKKPTDAFAMFTKAPPVVPFEQRWSVWTAGYGGSQSTDGNAVVGSNNTTSSIAGTAVGADYLISPSTIAGFALAGGGTSFSVANGGSGHSDLFQAGAYLRHTNGPAYVSAALAYGWQDITTNRTVTVAGLDQLRAEFNANAWSGRLEGGYRFVSPATGGVGITPYAAAQFVTFDLPAYAEQAIVGTNNFALGYGAKG